MPDYENSSVYFSGVFLQSVKLLFVPTFGMEILFSGMRHVFFSIGFPLIIFLTVIHNTGLLKILFLAISAVYSEVLRWL